MMEREEEAEDYLESITWRWTLAVLYCWPRTENYQ